MSKSLVSNLLVASQEGGYGAHKGKNPENLENPKHPVNAVPVNPKKVVQL